MDTLLKYKQIALKIGIPLLILGFLIFILLSGTTSSENKEKTNDNISLFDEDELVATRYTDSIEDKLNIAVSTQDDLQTENEKIKKELEALKQLIIKKSDQQQISTPSNNANLYTNFPLPQNNNSSNIQENEIENKLDNTKPKIFYKLMEPSPTAIDTNFGKIEKPKIKEETSQKLYLPTTSITTGSLLHGLNAPTQMSKPMPTVVMIKDVAFLPKRKQFDIKECNLLVEGYGQLSDERAYFRFVKFVCMSNDGKKIYDTKASGYITSLIDNKQGLPGHVVSKQNEMLKRMFLAGIFEGASDMFKDVGSTQITSGLGTTTTQSVDSEDRAKNIIGSGLNTASESAKELYLEKAKNISETVEVLAQDVGLVFTDGLILEPLDLDEKGKSNEKSN
jgi:conjugal transfer pilus assembly protein TraB